MAFQEYRTRIQSVFSRWQSAQAKPAATPRRYHKRRDDHAVLDPYFPPDLVGGLCPRIVGEEEDIVWQAAAQACGTERVHMVWQAVGNHIAYLAARSSDFASYTYTWCPFAALLPTAQDAGEAPMCYVYHDDSFAVLMMTGFETLQIFRGTAAAVRARAERVVRAMNNARIIELDSYRIAQMTPVPWHVASLFEDRARRILAMLSVMIAVTIIVVSLALGGIASVAMIKAHHDRQETIKNTPDQTENLLRQVEALRASPVRDQIDDFMAVNDAVIAVNGLLTIYEIKDGVTRWRALVPRDAATDRLAAVGGRQIEITDQGVVIGNNEQARYEAMAKGKAP